MRFKYDERSGDDKRDTGGLLSTWLGGWWINPWKLGLTAPGQSINQYPN